MKWDHDKHEMQALPDAQVSLSLALHSLQRMLTLLALIKRFHALRPNHRIQKVIGADSENPAAVLPWRVTLALTHTYSKELRGLWHQLANTGLWQLVLDASSYDAKDSISPAPGKNVGGSLISADHKPPLKTLMNPSSFS